MRWVDALLDLLFPPKCPFCGKVLEESGICPACRKELPWVPTDAPLRDLGNGLRCAGALWYEGPVRRGLLRFKFQDGSGAAKPLGTLLAQCAAERFPGEFDVVTWAPVSRKRLRQRGYDQAELLARSACRLWDTAPVRLLRKSVDTPAQSGLQEPAARRANVLGVYEAVDPARISGSRILLVDDICTTGATLAECGRVLLEAGAAQVVCAAVALTPAEKVHPPRKE